MAGRADPPRAGLVAWAAGNPVAANLLMFALLLGGIGAAFDIKQEVFPSFQLPIVDVEVSYPGASPEQVEDGIVLPIEEELRDLDVVERIVAVAEQGGASFEIELRESADRNRALQDVKNGIDRISFLPEDAERPVIELRQEQSDVLWMVVYGPLDERQIFELSERVRRDLLALPEVSHLEVQMGRAPEIHIEISQSRLRSLGLTLGEVARLIGDSARDVPAGGVRTPAGEVLLRTRERRDFASEYANIALVSSATGTKVRLGDVAVIRDGFEDRPLENWFNGGRGVFVRVYETGGEKPLEIAAAVRRYLDELEAELPPGVGVEMIRDRSEQYADRLNLLLRNGAIGLALVLCVLGAFLEPRLAFWVAAGIPTSIAGSLLLLPALGASINMISLFGFIITLGIVVDDAVIVGENVFHRMQQGVPRLRAAIEGARQMLVPVIFAVATNVVAFLPLLFVPGETGRFFAPLPAVVIAVFVVSLVESLLILPAHIGHGRDDGRPPRALAWLARLQQRSSARLDDLTERRFVPLVRACLAHRGLTLAVFFGGLAVMLAYYQSGRLAYTFSPVITGLRVDAEVQTPVGSAFEDTVRIAKRVEEAGLRAAERLGGGHEVLTGRMNVVGRRSENWADVNFYLVPAAERDFDEGEFAAVWREEVGEVPGLESLYYEWEEGPGSGAGMTIELSHPDRRILELAAADLASALHTFQGVTDIRTGVAAGKVQLDVDVTPEGRSLGLTSEDVGRQVRHAFYGAEALRFQRDRHEVKVMARLPESDRRSLSDVEGLILRTPDGGEIPLTDAARLRRGRAYTEIRRLDGQRVIEVRANVVPELANVGDVRAALDKSVLPDLAADHPGLTYEYSGRQREERLAMDRLRIGLAGSLLVIFAMLAALFRSYVQSAIVMLSIPFAVASALFGHWLLGYDLSIVSVFGMIALAGIVVNGGLVLTQETNRLLREEGLPLEQAVVAASRRRLRPVLLTALTTFAGLVPMIFETSSQARFLVPMAIALGFGVLLSTPAVLLLTPCCRMLAADAGELVRLRLRGRAAVPAPER
jgi:multidrug efflux pump subunit AcrB